MLELTLACIAFIAGVLVGWSYDNSAEISSRAYVRGWADGRAAGRLSAARGVSPPKGVE